MSEFVIENGMLKGYLGASNSIVIPDYVREIHSAAFYDRDTIDNIVVGAGVTKLKSSTFELEWLQKAYIPATVTDMEEHVFAEDGYGAFDVVVGGEKGSFAETYCNVRGIDFVEVKADGIDAFLKTPNEELCRSLDAQIEKENEFFVDESERGYCAELIGDTLRVFAPDRITKEKITVKNMQDKLTKRRLQKVKHLIIGDGITGINSFNNCTNLQSVWLGANVEEIDHKCFGYDFRIATIRVDERNKFYRSLEDSILFSYDLKTLIKYAPNRPDRFYAIPSFVETIAPSAFHHAGNLEYVRVGENVRAVGKFAFHNAYNIRHIYFDSVATTLEDWTVFTVDGDYCLCKCTWLLVVGCKQDSVVERWCKEHKIAFEIVDRPDAFLAPSDREEKGFFQFGPEKTNNE